MTEGYTSYLNLSGSTIPPYGVIMLKSDTTAEEDDYNFKQRLVGTKYSTSGSNDKIVAFNGPSQCPDGQFGDCSFANTPTWARIDSTSAGSYDLTDAAYDWVGLEFGPSVDSWVIGASGTGYYLCSTPDLTNNRVMVQRKGGGEVCPPCNAIWAVVVFGPPTGGSGFAVKFNGQTTATMPYNVSAAAFQAAMIALSNVGNDGDGNPNVVVRGTAFSWQVEFQNDLGSQPITEFSIASASFTGGSVYGVAILPYIVQQGRE